MMRPTKIYEHPEFTTEEADLSLFSTICLVLTMVLMGALFLMVFSSLVLWNDGTHCKHLLTTSYHSYIDIRQFQQGTNLHLSFGQHRKHHHSAYDRVKW